MNVFPLGVFVYIYSATACFLYSFHFKRLYKQTGNEYSKMFFKLGIGMTVYFLLLGLPNLIASNTYKSARGMIWVIALLPFFLAINYPLKTALIAWGKKEAARMIPSMILLLTTMLIFVQIQFGLPNPETDHIGIIHHNVPIPFNIIIATLGIITTGIPTFFLFKTKTAIRKASIKKFLFAITFLFGGLGGWSTILFYETFVLLIAFIVMFLGFTALYAMMLVEIFMKENPTTL